MLSKMPEPKHSWSKGRELGMMEREAEMLVSETWLTTI